MGKLFVHENRIACGSSCAPTGESYAGTMGALVRKAGRARSLYILSNNHVLAACNHVQPGMPIMAPSSIDGRPGVPAPSEVARHSEICELRSGEPRLVSPCREDIALAQVTDPGRVSSWQGSVDEGYDTPNGIVPLAAGMKVKKVGRSSGFTLGTVEALIPSATPIPYKAKEFAGNLSGWRKCGRCEETQARPLLFQETQGVWL